MATPPEPQNPTGAGPDGGAIVGVALVTGAARGIGAATVRRLLSQGWGVVATDICGNIDGLGYPMGTLKELRAVVDGSGGRGVAVVADVRDRRALDAAVEIALDRFGRLDAAIACAGVMLGATHGWEMTPRAFDLCVDINLGGVQRCASAALPAIIESATPGAGRFVAVASAAASSGRPQIAAYSAAKAGVIGLVRSLAAELAPLGVTANCVSPGSTDTTILAASAALYGLADPAEFVAHQPVGRLLDPDEVAAGIAWLCSPQRGGVTGIVLPIDGGMTV